jgi:hypothetical protein
MPLVANSCDLPVRSTLAEKMGFERPLLLTIASCVCRRRAHTTSAVSALARNSLRQLESNLTTAGPPGNNPERCHFAAHKREGSVRFEMALPQVISVAIFLICG